MERLESICEKEINEILEFLYQDELMNVFMIHCFENGLDRLGEVYIERGHETLLSLVHIKDDGNSHFTTYYTRKANGLQTIAQLLKTLNLSDILLAGKAEEVKYILKVMGLKKEVSLNPYYKLNRQKYNKLAKDQNITLHKVRQDIHDHNTIKEYLISFFEAETETAVKRITNEHKMNEIIHNGIYILEFKNQPVGMARFYGQSNRFIDITTLYVHEEMRGKGFGKILVSLMVEIAFSKNKIPILQTSKDNKGARKIYEEFGFEVVCDYAFQLLS